MPFVVPRYESMQYNGTNGQDIVDWLNGSADLASDDGTQLVLLYCGSPRAVAVGNWVVAGGSGAYRGFHAEMTNELYQALWREIPA
ncbi:hypothetical protein ABZ135_22010 [Streptomyces sp. NPDC006339]|uniref:hypothetical protein n=1 Tax=Streptomyces sp. NPDC006339 TaxID=3156755 RepID=UPI0033B56A03